MSIGSLGWLPYGTREPPHQNVLPRSQNLARLSSSNFLFFLFGFAARCFPLCLSRSPIDTLMGPGPHGESMFTSPRERPPSHLTSETVVQRLKRCHRIVLVIPYTASKRGLTGANGQQQHKQLQHHQLKTPFSSSFGRASLRGRSCAEKPGQGCSPFASWIMKSEM